MNFLPDVMVPCEVCMGKRYNRETLEVRYKGKSIADVLNMNINKAVEFFESIPDIIRKIRMIQNVGLGYIRLGQSSTTLSGGESQRIKLASFLAKEKGSPSLFIFDEPTTGLDPITTRVIHELMFDMQQRLKLTSVVISHDVEIFKYADKVALLNEGKIEFFGDAKTIFASDNPYVYQFVRGLKEGPIQTELAGLQDGY